MIYTGDCVEVMAEANALLCQVEGCGNRHRWFVEPGLYLCQKHADAIEHPFDPPDEWGPGPLGQIP